MGEFVKVAAKSDIPAGSGRKVEVNGKEIAIFNCDGTFYAIDEICAHRGGPLSEGELNGLEVTCPWHGWRFNIANGTSPMSPAAKVNCYGIKIEGNDIYVSA